MASAPTLKADFLPAALAPPDFDEVYRDHFDFVWASVRRLGVHPPATDDVVQETFLVAYRKLKAFEGRSSVRCWLFGIARRVVSDHRRSKKRKPEAPLEESGLRTDTRDGPHAVTASKEAALVLADFLESLPAEQREVFVAIEIEQLSAPELAKATGTRLNTVYSRLRLARAAFERTAKRHAERQRTDIDRGVAP